MNEVTQSEYSLIKWGSQGPRRATSIGGVGQEDGAKEQQEDEEDPPQDCGVLRDIRGPSQGENGQEWSAWRGQAEKGIIHSFSNRQVVTLENALQWPMKSTRGKEVGRPGDGVDIQMLWVRCRNS